MFFGNNTKLKKSILACKPPKRKTGLKMLFLLWLLTFFASGFLSISLVPATQKSNTFAVPNAFRSAAVTVDGKILPGEYPNSISLASGNFVLYWFANVDLIYFGIEGRTSGWVAIGINPEKRMLHADMYFGWVNASGDVGAIDAYSTGETGPHPPDKDLGGTFDIAEYDGRENSSYTTFEFKRKLTTGDAYDKDIPSNGTVKIIWALGASDAFLDKHTDRGLTRITISQSPTEETSSGGEQPTLLGFPPVIIYLAGLVFVVAVILYVLKKHS